MSTDKLKMRCVTRSFLPAPVGLNIEMNTGNPNLCVWSHECSGVDLDQNVEGLFIAIRSLHRPHCIHRGVTWNQRCHQVILGRDTILVIQHREHSWRCCKCVSGGYTFYVETLGSSARFTSVESSNEQHDWLKLHTKRRPPMLELFTITSVRRLYIIEYL